MSPSDIRFVSVSIGGCMNIRMYCAVPMMALALAGCVKTAPQQTTFWNKCDGYAAPEGAGKLAGRGLVTAATLGIVWAMPEEDKPWARLQGIGGIAACDEALSQEILDIFPVRKLNILRARAIHNLQVLKYEAAAADIAAMHALLPSLKGEQRDMHNATSAVQIVEAVYLMKTGDLDAGVATIRDLAADRPYSMSLLNNFVGFLPKGWHKNPENSSLLTMMARFTDELVLARALASVSDLEVDASTVDDWKFVIRSRFSITGAQHNTKSGSGRLAVADPTLYLAGAMTVARAGETELAREWLAVVSDVVADMGGGDIEHQTTKYTTRSLAPHELMNVRRMLPHYETALTSYAHYHAWEYALARLPFENIEHKLPVNRLMLPLVELLQGTVPAEERKGILKADIDHLEMTLGMVGGNPKTSRGRPSDLFDTLSVWRPYEQSNSYSHSLSFLKVDGFKDKKLKDGSWKIQFVGSASSLIAVEEMSMLRAAQIAQKRKASHFLVDEQKNYRRTVTTYMNGTPISGAEPAGFKTELFIKLFTEAEVQAMGGAQRSRLFEAKTTFDELFKVYGGDKKKKRR